MHSMKSDEKRSPILRGLNATQVVEIEQDTTWVYIHALMLKNSSKKVEKKVDTYAQF